MAIGRQLILLATVVSNRWLAQAFVIGIGGELLLFTSVALSIWFTESLLIALECDITSCITVL